MTQVGKGTVVTFLAAALLAGCGASGLSRAGPGELSHGGISIFVPDRWYGRILFGDQAGERAIFEVANFRLADQEGFEPPRELPAGEEDPIKAMSGKDVLVLVDTARTTSSARRSLPVRVARRSFVTLDSLHLPVPAGHAVARTTACSHGRCLVITVDCATHPVSREVVRAANGVLASLRVGSGTT